MKRTKKIKSVILLILLPCILSIQPLVLFSQQKDNHKRSKQLIERYNKFRRNKLLPVVQHDTILDNVAQEILCNDRRYRKSTNTFNEDSIRCLFYNNGVIDYIFEIKDIAEKDVAGNRLKAFFLADSSRNIKMGYSKQRTKNLLIKTNSYIRFEHGECFKPKLLIDELHNKSKTIQVSVKTDSIKYYLQIVTPGKYYYHYSNHIPTNDERVNDFKTYKA